jgi:sugar O-acyltransferase (sialic acid O-acetyltransferase NeuD family)
LLIVGAGGHGRVVADIAFQSGRWESIAFLDDRFPDARQVFQWMVLGKIYEANQFRENYPEAIIAIGANSLRLGIQKKMSQLGFQFPVLIHPDASVSQFTSLGAGTVICPQAAVIIGSKVGLGVIINTGASIGHDCSLEDGVHVAPGVRLAGRVSIGECSWIGIGATVKECLSIGSGATVGAGSTILSDVPDGATAVGSPGKIISSLG